jgi:PRP38 family
LYVRLTGRPVDIYKALEPLYADSRKLRFSQHQQWSIVHMDEYIHNLLTETHVVGITLPRLIARNVLEEAGYIDNESEAADDDDSIERNGDQNQPYVLPRRPTALKDVLLQYGGPLAYLKHKAVVELCPEAMAVWQERPEAAEISQAADAGMEHGATGGGDDDDDGDYNKRKNRRRHRCNENDNEDDKKKPKKNKTRNYDNLFKTNKSSSTMEASSSTDAAATEDGPVEEGSAEYWNERRAKLGLAPLKE